MKKSVLSVISTLTGVAIGAGVMGKVANKSADRIQTMSDKHLALFLMMNQWVRVKQNRENISSYFEKNDYKEVAIYGMSYVGETLLNELKNTEIKIAYGIDKNAEGIYSEINIVSPDEELKEVDAIIVTSIYYIDEIKDMLSKKVSCPIISLGDILYEM